MGLIGAAAAALIAFPASALALTSTNPTSLDLGGQAVGTQGAEQNVTLTVDCDSVTVRPLCTTPVVFVPAISTTGDFSQTNNCGLVLTALTQGGMSCQISVQFAPASAGARSGSLLTGGPIVPLSGTGLDPSGAGGGGGAGTGTSTGTSGSPDRDERRRGKESAAKKKKCKKKHRHKAAAPKKCKKKRRHH